jgi:[acyl-carrier-protein] S-malonyltransferase
VTNNAIANPPLVFMFPGQSSRYPGMLDRLVELYPDNGELLAWSSDLLGRDLAAHYHVDRGEHAFARNVDVQVGVFLANHMFLRMLDAAGIEAELSLGLSLGEWNHLVHIGVISFADALRAVALRGRLYDEGPRGWMAAIQPIGDEDLAEVVAAAEPLGVIEVVNLNSPHQHVVAGERAAVEAAVEHAEEQFYAQCHIIDRNVPMHSSLFREVGQRFRAHLEQIEFRPATRPYLPNRLAQLIANPSRELLIETLAAHVHEPVLWRQSLDHIVAAHPEAIFVEVGPMSVLHNLMHKKWLRNRKFRTDSRDELADHFANVVANVVRELESSTPSYAPIAAHAGSEACTPS